MDLKLLGALALLAIWAIGALVYEAPGWIHLLLTAGVSLLIYAVVSRDHPAADAPATRDGTR